MDIAAWLRALGLEQYAPAFRANDIDARVLPGLTAEDLKEIGVASVGHRRLILQAIAAMSASSPSAATAAATVPPGPPPRRWRTRLPRRSVGSSR